VVARWWPALGSGTAKERRFASSACRLREFLAHPAEFESATSAFGGQRSIQLSYGCLAFEP
jgi:hypothetical protein